MYSITRQTFPANEFEVVVVDNGSTDGTNETINSLIKNHPRYTIRYFCEPEPGLLSARHRGVLEAKGELLVFVDDDIEAVPGWLTAIVTGFDDAKVQLIGGPSLPKYENDPPPWIETFWNTTSEGGRWCWHLSLLDLGHKSNRINPSYIIGLNLAIRRNAFLDLGGFHPDTYSNDLQHFQGDGEAGLTFAAEARGLIAMYEPAATVYHFVPATRMTIDYFEKRAKAEGIRHSYSEVRHYGIARATLRFRARRVSSGINSYVKRLGHTRSQPEEATVAAIRQRIAHAHQSGFEFHQRALRLNQNLLAWVLKPNYWDYRLPR